MDAGRVIVNSVLGRTLVHKYLVYRSCEAQDVAADNGCWYKGGFHLLHHEDVRWSQLNFPCPLRSVFYELAALWRLWDTAAAPGPGFTCCFPVRGIPERACTMGITASGNIGQSLNCPFSSGKRFQCSWAEIWTHGTQSWESGLRDWCCLIPSGGRVKTIGVGHAQRVGAAEREEVWGSRVPGWVLESLH